MDEVLSEFLNNKSIRKSSIAKHLQDCPTVQRRPNTDKGVECDHDYYWGVSAAEVYAARGENES